MARRTKEEIQNNIDFLRKHSGRLISFTDTAERLGISLGQLDYTFECMKVNEAGKQEVEDIKSKIKSLSYFSKNMKNYKTVKFQTDTQLGINSESKKKVGLFIDSLSKETILEEGFLRPRKDDILYIVEQEENKILFRKFLVLDVEIRNKNIKIYTLNFIKLDLAKGDFLQQLSGYDISGVDMYILSKA